MKAQEKKRSASCYRGLRTGVRRATCRAPEGDSLQRQRRQTLSEAIISFVGLDVHHDSIAGGSAPEGREEPRFFGTMVPQWAALSKTFDELDWDLMLKAVRKHVKDRWALLYIERWLKAPFVTQEGVVLPRSKGTPQGGVISCVLMNLFMHYAFD